MEGKKFICLFLLGALFLASSSCHPRRLSDIKPSMTREEVASLWGKTPLITHKRVDEKAVEIWEYHFSGSGSVCWVTFSEDRVTTTQCRPQQAGTYWSSSQPGQSQAEPPLRERSLVREGYFAAELAEVLKVGEVENEAEAESKLASVGITPRNGWIADYPLTPKIIGELENAVGEAADSGKLTMNREEAVRAFQDLAANLESRSEGVETAPDRESYPESYPEPYPSPRFYYYPYAYPFPYPYPYPFGGTYRFHHPHRGHWR